LLFFRDLEYIKNSTIHFSILFCIYGVHWKRLQTIHKYPVKALFTGLKRTSRKGISVTLLMILCFTLGLLTQSIYNIMQDSSDTYGAVSIFNSWLGYKILAMSETNHTDDELSYSVEIGDDLAVRTFDGNIGYLHPFSTVTDLIRFLEEDKTDQYEYSKDFDCDDFAFTLSQNAMSKGYQLFPFAEGKHLRNVAHVSLGNDSILTYIVEPQTDQIIIWGQVD